MRTKKKTAKKCIRFVFDFHDRQYRILLLSCRYYFSLFFVVHCVVQLMLVKTHPYIPLLFCKWAKTSLVDHLILYHCFLSLFVFCLMLNICDMTLFVYNHILWILALLNFKEWGICNMISLTLHCFKKIHFQEQQSTLFFLNQCVRYFRSELKG